MGEGPTEKSATTARSQKRSKLPLPNLVRAAVSETKGGSGLDHCAAYVAKRIGDTPVQNAAFRIPFAALVCFPVPLRGLRATQAQTRLLLMAVGHFW